MYFARLLESIGILISSIYSKDKTFLKVYAITAAIMGLCYYGEKIWS